MAIDTNPTMPERVINARKDRERLQCNGDTTPELITDEPATAPRADLEALLAHLDGVFRPLMERARAQDPGNSRLPALTAYYYNLLKKYGIQA